MFHWICPECGREIAPTVRECPVCDSGAEQAELVLAGVVEASARIVHLDASARGVQGDVSGRNGSGDVSARGGRGDEVAEPAGRTAAVADPLPKPVKWSRTNGDAAAIREIPPKPLQELVPEKDSSMPVPADVRSPVCVSPPVAAEAPALIPEILDAKSAFDRMVEAKAANILGITTQEIADRGVASRGPEGWVNPATPSESRAITTRTLESRAVETRPIESRLVDARPIDSKLVDSKPVDAKLVEARTVETKAAQSRVVESKPVETKSVETKSIETKPIESKSIDTTAAEFKTAEEKPVASKSIDSKISEPELPVQASPVSPAEEPAAVAQLPPPIDRVPLLAKLSRLAQPKIASRSSAQDEATDETAGNVEKHAARPSTPTDAQNPDPNVASVYGGHDAKAGVTPEATTHELLLPSFDAPTLESLHSLVAAVGKLDEEMFADVMSGENLSDKQTFGDVVSQADPPAWGKLSLPHSSEGAPPDAPAVAGHETIAPEAMPPRSVEIVRLAAPVVSESERKLVSLRLVETPLPLTRPLPQAMKAAGASQVVALPPKAGAVRAPRSRPAFLAPRFARLVKYSPLAKRPLRPIPPPEDLRRSDTAPRVTLPGPMLTRALVSFQDRELKPIFQEARAFRKRFAYGWLLIVLVVGTVLGVGLSTTISPPPHPSETKTSTEGKAVDAATQGQASPAPVHATGSNPLSKVLEVTGFRIVMDPSRKAEVQYLVVNHSGSRFSNATVYVTLHAADARVGQPPLCRFSFAAPRLGPFEAKEMISAIEKTNRPVDLPEWQDLRAEIEIGQ